MGIDRPGSGQTTLRPRPRRRPAWGGPHTLALTIVHHPDMCRIGERAVLAANALAGGRYEIARAAPGFGHPGRPAQRPLEDRFVSRRPMVLTVAAGGTPVTLQALVDTTEVHIGEGDAVRGAAAFTIADLEAGVVLELAGRVVLLLHTLPAAHEQAPPPLGLVGAHPGIDALRRGILDVADLAAPVLVRGESGAGKELVASALHRMSPRAGQAFVTVNMAAIPASTAAAELFGHTRGAFTGAGRARRGFFGRADGGTLFLDEIGATPAEIQPMLLRVFETGEIQPVGSDTARQVDVRLIAATDLDLDAAVASGSFRLPLLHRLSGYELIVPPLRERRADVARLLFHFLCAELAAIGQRDRLDDPGPGRDPWFPAWLAVRLLTADWPGNVRQLQNVVRQLVVSNRETEELVVPPPVERMLAERAVRSRTPAAAAAAITPAPAAPKGWPSDDISEATLRDGLRANQWRIGDTAQQLHISKRKLYRLIGASETLRVARDLQPEEIRAAFAAAEGSITVMAAELEVSRRGLVLRMRELGLLP